MFGTALCIATVVLGIEVGWEPDADGDLEYIVRIEPELAAPLLEGKPVRFSVLPEHRGVRHFRVEVGAGKPPREGTLPPPPSAPAQPSETAAKVAPNSLGPEFSAPPSTSSWPKFEPDKPAAPPLVEPKPATSIEPAEPGAEPDLPRATPTPESVEVDKPSDASTVRIPAALPTDETARKIDEQKASHDKPSDTEKPDQTGQLEATSPNALKTPLILASCAAIGFFAAFAYLLWIHVGTRTRYRQLLNDYYAAVGNLPGGGASESARLSPSV
ncbi:MAG TPA: hypothetical protein DD670_04555 [Planctomycetaceae bacterium]|nr:hypothetical protein [Planctomycetaceae bacterium]